MSNKIDKILAEISAGELFDKITILESRIVNKNFHSRFSAKKKYYLYKILNRNTQSYIHENKVWFIPQKINIEKMKDASEFFLGKKIKFFKKNKFKIYCSL